jgi:hypothetical protein
VAWLTIEMITLLVPVFDGPNWLVRTALPGALFVPPLQQGFAAPGPPPFRSALSRTSAKDRVGHLIGPGVRHRADPGLAAR